MKKITKKILFVIFSVMTLFLMILAGVMFSVVSLSSSDFTMTNAEVVGDNIQLQKGGFDTSTIVYNSLLAITDINGFSFSNDGFRVFMVRSGVTNIYEYHCTNSFDISTCSYDSAFSFADQETVPRGITFNDDGTKVFLVGSTGDDVNEFHCSVGFDVSTCSYDSIFSVSAQDTVPTDIEFSADGTKMLILGFTGDTVEEYHCSVGFDVSTCSYDSTFGVGSQESYPNGFAFNNDGTKMFVIGTYGDDVNEYHCSVGFDISTCVFQFSTSTIDSYPTDIEFSADGTKMFTSELSVDRIREWDLSGDYFATGSIEQTVSTITTEEFSILTLNYTGILNGGEIVPYLIIDDVEESLVDNELSGIYPIGADIKVKLDLTGSASATPQIPKDSISLSMEYVNPLTGMTESIEEMVFSVFDSSDSSESISSNLSLSFSDFISSVKYFFLRLFVSSEVLD